MSKRLLLLCAVFLIALPSPAAAQATPQDPEPKRWGVIASFTPMWKANRTLQEKLFWSDPDEETPLFEGSEFTIGFVRGTTRGGDWGVSYVRKPLKDISGTSTIGPFTECFIPESCYTYEETSTVQTRDILVDGVEVHFFIPFVRFANRVQMGINVGGGVGFSSGAYAETNTTTYTFTEPGQPPTTETDTYSVEGEAAGELIGAVVPLAKAEFQTSILIARGLKANVSIGMNVPSAFSFRVGVTYLFGAR